MRSAFFAVLLFSILFLTANNFSYSQSKTSNAVTNIGIVDVEAIVKEMPEAVAADKELVALSNAVQDTLVQKRTALETKYQNYEKQKAMMAQAKQTEELELLQKEAMEMQNYQTTKTTEIQEKRETLLAPIRNKVKEAIESIAKDEKLTLVLAKDAAAVIMYFDTKLDITFRVIDRMKRGN